jgi:hypothetical protein
LKESWWDCFWFLEEAFFFLDQELYQIRLVELVVVAQEVPGVPDVFFSLLKRNLFSDGIGLISHWFLWGFMGIYGRRRDSGGIFWVLSFTDLGGVLMWTLKVSGMFLLGFFWDSDRLLWVSVECPSDIAFGILLFWFLSKVVCGSGIL